MSSVPPDQTMEDYRQCALYKTPDVVLAAAMAERFELLETCFETSHDWRYVLSCRDCGQRYVFDFHEETDWSGGQDGQYRTWAVVWSDAHLEQLKALSHLALARQVPRLVDDLPLGSEDRRHGWIEMA